jgi:release factor glutamine methyltransferase
MLAGPGMQLRDALQQAQAQGLPRLDAQLLLGHVLRQPRTWLIAHDDQTLTPLQAHAWQGVLNRRVAGEPLAYIVGKRGFHGLVLQVSPAVLVPRPETELLVDWALACLPTAPAATVIDLGTGSGAVALAVKHKAPSADVTATDASAAALSVAQGNAERLQLAVRFAAGSWWQAVPGRKFGLALSNPPYIAGADEHLAALQHEPRMALTPEGDGLGALRDIIGGAPVHLLPGAWLLLEHGHDQAAAVQGLLLAGGFATPQTRLDLAGLPRCTGAVWTRAN